MEDIKYCFKCEEALTPETTKYFGGFDESNYRWAKSLGKEPFTKCDDCFQAEAENYLEAHQY